MYLMLEKKLCYLHGIQGCAFLDLISTHKQVQAVIVWPWDISSYPSNEHIILIRRI